MTRHVFLLRDPRAMGTQIPKYLGQISRNAEQPDGTRKRGIRKQLIMRQSPHGDHNSTGRCCTRRLLIRNISTLVRRRDAGGQAGQIWVMPPFDEELDSRDIAIAGS
jgi:hypothetical protein